MDTIPSESFQFNKEDGKKILKGLAISMGGAGIVYLAAIFNAIDTQYDTPIWVALAANILNILQIWARGKIEPPK